MQRTLTFQVGVVLAREDSDHPWQDHEWRALEVFLNAPEVNDWRELRRGDGFVHYHAATLPLDLHRKETNGYNENLLSAAPSLYVILRTNDLGEEDERPIDVHMVTASVHEVEAYGEDGSEIISVVPMPPKIYEFIGAFVDEYHSEDPFFKRKRKKYHQEEEHKFGSEPIAELRRRHKADDVSLDPLQGGRGRQAKDRDAGKDANTRKDDSR